MGFLRLSILLLWFVAAALPLGALPTGVQAAGQKVVVLTAKGPVTPVMAGYVQRGLRVAQEHAADVAILQLDTPGGLDSSMRDIIQTINGSTVPVVVYVAPAGARAASAGAFITMAGHVAAMAPNTAIGAAHPVGGQGEDIKGTMKDKVENDAVAYIRSIAQERGRNQEWAEKAVRESISSPAQDALQQHVVDLIATDLNDLIRQLDGRMVKSAGGEKRLSTADAVVERADMNPLESFLFTITDPNVAYLLLSLATLAIFLELSNPGAILPGIVGGIALVLALFALGTLPVNIAGLLLIGLALALFVAEVWITAHGLLTAGGIVSLALGSLILFSGASPELQVDRGLIAAVVGFFSIFFFLIVRAIWKVRRVPEPTGTVTLVGQHGIARTPLRPQGTVMLNGELWQARSAEGSIPAGTRVVVRAVEGFKLIVAPEPVGKEPVPVTSEREGAGATS